MFDDPEGSAWEQWACGYVRVSTDAQAEEGYSIDAQIEYIKNQAALVEPRPGKLKLYVDGGFSGSNINRPAMKKLIEDAQGEKVTHVIVYKLDRLSRSQKDTLYLIEDVFNLHNISFVSIKESLDTSSPLGRLMIGILSAFAQLERENIRERTRMGMLERVKKGFWPGGGRIPFGYDYNAEQGVLVPNKDAGTVRLIYDLYLQGYAIYRIAQMVGLKYERLAHQILNRKSNCGYIVYNGVEYKGRHEPLIDEKIYERAMQLQRERSANHVPSSSQYLLSGLIRCGRCGAKVRYQKWGNKGARLVCYSQQNTHKHLIKDAACTQEKLWAGDVEDAVLRALFSFQIRRDDRHIGGEAEATVLDVLEAQRATAVKKLRRLYDLYAEAVDDVLLTSIEAAKKEMRNLQAQLDAEMRQQVVTQRNVELRNAITDLRSNWDLLTEQEKKSLMNDLVDIVIIDGEEVHVKFNV